jgi:hypothetical protein
VDVLFCTECGIYFYEDDKGDIIELDRLPTPNEELRAIDIICEDHN